MMIGASMDSIAMVEGEMKEMEADAWKRLNLLTNIKIKFLLNCVYKLLLERKKFVPRRKREAFTKVKALLMIKFMQLQRRVQLNTNSSAAFAEIKEEVKALFTEEELAENGDLISRYFSKTNKSSS
jgi:polyribonucleotide nucleotidyltransferase